MTCVTIRIIGAADGSRTPHDGRYVVEWSPHTRYGTLHCTTIQDRARAMLFDKRRAILEWHTISRVQPTRPDGRPNRPLTAVHVVFEDVDSE